jgi:hypothetical protein
VTLDAYGWRMIASSDDSVTISVKGVAVDRENAQNIFPSRRCSIILGTIRTLGALAYQLEISDAPANRALSTLISFNKAGEKRLLPGILEPRSPAV